MDIKKIGFGLAAFATGALVWVVAIGKFGPAPGGRKRLPDKGKPREDDPAAEHVPTDLLGDQPPQATDRAPEAFRPDPTAIPTAEEREALRPVTGPAPTLVADRGSGFAEAAGAA